jgi:hypothetical protein
MMSRRLWWRPRAHDERARWLRHWRACFRHLGVAHRAGGQGGLDTGGAVIRRAGTASRLTVAPVGRMAPCRPCGLLTQNSDPHRWSFPSPGRLGLHDAAGDDFRRLRHLGRLGKDHRNQRTLPPGFPSKQRVPMGGLVDRLPPAEADDRGSAARGRRNRSSPTICRCSGPRWCCHPHPATGAPACHHAGRSTSVG